MKPEKELLTKFRAMTDAQAALIEAQAALAKELDLLVPGVKEMLFFSQSEIRHYKFLVALKAGKDMTLKRIWEDAGMPPHIWTVKSLLKRKHIARTKDGKYNITSWGLGDIERSKQASDLKILRKTLGLPITYL